MSEGSKPNGVRLTAAVVAAVVSALAGTGAGVATRRLDPAATTAPDLERRLVSVEARVQTAEVERAAFTAAVNEKLETLIERVSALDVKLDRLSERRR